MIDFGHIQYLTFDCYGTLIDWETGILGALGPILRGKDIDLDDELILETYAELEAEAEAGPYISYREVLARVVDGFGNRYGFPVSDDDRDMMIQSLGQWPAFSDSFESLARLATRFKLVALSNVDDDLFAGSARRLGDPFDRVITAQQVKSYKPAVANFEVAIHALGGRKAEIVHVAQSLYHDIGPANRVGLSTVWINRRKRWAGSGATPPAEAIPDLEFGSLSEFASYL